MTQLSKTALVAFTLLTACAPLQIFYKEGETVAKLSDDLTRCEVSALTQVPPDIRTRYIPPQYAPYQICNGTSCTWHQRLISPGRFEQYDAHISLRNSVSDQCMVNRGYVKTKIKLCDTETIRATPIRATQVLPPITAKSCAIRIKSNRWQIVSGESD